MWKTAEYLGSDVEEITSSSHTALGAIRTRLVMESRSVPCGRLAIGALVLNMPTTTAPLLTTPVQLTAASSTLGTLTSAVIARQPQPGYFVTS